MKELLKCKWAMDRSAVEQSDTSWREQIYKQLRGLGFAIGLTVLLYVMFGENVAVLGVFISIAFIPPIVGSYFYAIEGS